MTHTESAPLARPVKRQSLSKFLLLLLLEMPAPFHGAFSYARESLEQDVSLQKHLWEA